MVTYAFSLYKNERKEYLMAVAVSTRNDSGLG
jgi:hypothetical protein